MYVPTTHPVLDHKFVTGTELLELYRVLRRHTDFPAFYYRNILNIGTKILNAGNERFPEFDVYFDLEGSMLGLVYSILLNISGPDLVPAEKMDRRTKFEKAMNELYQTLDVNKVNPNRGFYNRKCFEEHFGLTWMG